MIQTNEDGVVYSLTLSGSKTIGIVICVGTDAPHAFSASLAWYSWIVIISGVRYLFMRASYSEMFTDNVASGHAGHLVKGFSANF